MIEALVITIAASFIVLSLAMTPQPSRAQETCALSPGSGAQLRLQDHGLSPGKHDAEVVDLLKSAQERCPDNWNITGDLARAEAATGDTSDAERLVEDLLKRHDTSELHNLLGAIRMAQSDWKGAAVEYQHATTMNPDEQNLFDFGTSLMKVNYGAAESVLVFGTKRFPTSVKLHVALGLALYAQDRAEEGAKVLCHAAELDTSDKHPMEVLADTQTIPRAQLPEAIGRLSALQQRYPSDALILFDLAMARSGAWSGDSVSATPELVASLQQAISLDPHLSKAYVALASAYAEEKDYPQEIAALQRAVALAPELAQTHYRLAFAYREAGDQQHFREEIERFRALHAKQLTEKQ